MGQGQKLKATLKREDVWSATEVGAAKPARGTQEKWDI